MNSIQFVLLVPLLSLLLLPLLRINRSLYYIVTVSLALFNTGLAFSIPLGTEFHAGFLGFIEDKYTWIFALSINLSWAFVMTYTYSFDQYKFRQNEMRYLLFLSLSIFVVTANAFAENFQTLILFYLVAIPVSYPLLTIRDDERTKEVARDYVKQTFFPPLLMVIPAFVIIHMFTNSYSFYHVKTFVEIGVDKHVGIALLVLLVFGFSKNSIFPFNTWLPHLRRVPAPVSSLAHSVTTVNMGAIALIKIFVYVFGIGYINEITQDFASGGFIIHVAGLTAVYTAYLALKTKDLKERLSYSTVGQLMYIIVGLLIGTPVSIMAAALHILTHAVAKSGLFYVAGYFDNYFHTTKTNEVAELAPKNIFLVMVVAICGLSIIGVPLLAGSYGKHYILEEAYHYGRYSSIVYLLVGAYINFLYIYPLVKAAFRKGVTREWGFKEIPIGMKIVLIATLTIILGFSQFIENIAEILVTK